MDKKIYLGIGDKKRCPGPVYVIEKGDSLYSIAQKYHTRVRVLLDLNPFVDIYNLQPGDEICIPSDNMPQEMKFTPYVIKKDETIGDIMEKFSVSFEELAKINKVLLEQKLPPGIIIPVSYTHLRAHETSWYLV